MAKMSEDEINQIAIDVQAATIKINDFLQSLDYSTEIAFLAVGNIFQAIACSREDRTTKSDEEKIESLNKTIDTIKYSAAHSFRVFLEKKKTDSKKNKV